MLLRSVDAVFRVLFLCACLLVSHDSAEAKELPQRNIVIAYASVDIHFVSAKGNDGSVLVKESSRTIYRCKEYGTTVPIVEFYNDQVRLDNVKVFTDGVRDMQIQPVHDYYHQDDFFYHDVRTCQLILPFEKQGSKQEVVIDKTILNPLYLSTINLTDQFAIENKVVTISVPDWLEVDIKELNFQGWDIERLKKEQNGKTVYTYTVRNAKALEAENHMPGPGYFMPHLLVMVKEAHGKDITKTYFKTTADLYKWCHQLVAEIGNEDSAIRIKAEEITSGKTSDSDRVRALYYWVQQHIRYIAFENGIAAFRPEKAQEVLRKKYGDCKGMANLLVVMLRSLGYDARLCWLGTNYIPYDYSTPSVAVNNHMIAAWMRNGQPVFLDGTEKFIGFGETAERIQGRQVLIENGDDYLLQTVPVASHTQNTSTEQRELSVDGQDLKGRVKHIFRGENKEQILGALAGIGVDKREDVLLYILSGGNASFQISNLKTSDPESYNEDLVLEYELTHKSAFTRFGTEHYLDMDNRKLFSDCIIDTAKHHLPYQFPFKDHQILEIRIMLPPGATAKNLPQSVALKNASYGYTGGWQQKNNELSYRTETWMEKTFFPTSQLQLLNQDLQPLKHFYTAQPELTF